jgi:hypothetical protein
MRHVLAGEGLAVDAIVLDCRMPGEPSAQLALHAKSLRLPVVMISGHIEAMKFAEENHLQLLPNAALAHGCEQHHMSRSYRVRDRSRSRRWAVCSKSVRWRRPGGRHRGSQRMKHGDHGGCANAGAEENDGPVTGSQREAARCARVEDVANPDLSVDIGSGQALGFALDAYAVASLTRLVRQRILRNRAGASEVGRSRNTINCPGKAASKGARQWARAPARSR